MPKSIYGAYGRPQYASTSSRVGSKSVEILIFYYEMFRAHLDSHFKFVIVAIESRIRTKTLPNELFLMSPQRCQVAL
jgi:hypothetical protein